MDTHRAELFAALEASGHAFFTANASGRVTSSAQPLLTEWLGPLPADPRVWTYLAPEDPGLRGAIEVGWAAVFENLLPLELTLDQLPSKIRCGARTLRITYRALGTEEHTDKLVIVVSDATAQEEREAAEATQRELSLLMRRLVKDTAAVEEFFDDGYALVETIERSAAEPDLTLLRRALHTLKGNSGFFGLSRFAAQVHEVESVVADGQAVPRGEISSLVAAWEEIALAVSPFLGSRCDMVDVSTRDLERLVRAAEQPAHSGMVDLLKGLLQESMERRLGRLAQQARALAADLGKDLEVKIESDGERWEKERFATFWSTVVHVLRNAVDHGIETRDERVQKGKAPRGQITLRVEETPFVRIFELQDDGGGIDFKRLRARASMLGDGAHEAVEQLSDTELLFVDGLSSRESVTELSGRGIGLGATRAACQALGGTVQVESRIGEGTRFRFTFPKRAAAREASAA